VSVGTWPLLGALAFWLGASLLVFALLAVFFVLYTLVVCILFVPTMMRVFEETPLFVPPDDQPVPGAEEVRFQASDGVWLRGCWLLTSAPSPRGTIVFCHEFLSNRWSCRPYCKTLLENGYDIFSFDFRNHGESESLPHYSPMFWASNFELTDLQAALAQVREQKRDTNPWTGLLGVSRGGTAAILAAAVEKQVRAVVTDGAFPTRGTQLAYMLRWARIYIGDGLLYRLTPEWYYSLLCAIARTLGARRHGCRFPKVSQAIRKLAPRPLLMIHGGSDNYIVPVVAEGLFRCAREPKEWWLVPQARHNGAIQVAQEAYGRRILEFFNAAHTVAT